MSTYSKEHKDYLKKIKKNKIIVLFFQIFIILSFLIIWEVTSRLGLINSFLTSSPSKVFNINLVITGVVLLALLSYIMYFIISYIEKKNG